MEVDSKGSKVLHIRRPSIVSNMGRKHLQQPNAAARGGGEQQHVGGEGEQQHVGGEQQHVGGA